MTQRSRFIARMALADRGRRRDRLARAGWRRFEEGALGACRAGISGFQPLYCGIDREGQPDLIEKRAGDQAASGENPPKSVEQFRIRRGLRAPEFVELSLEGQPGNIINGLTER